MGFGVLYAFQCIGLQSVWGYHIAGVHMMCPQKKMDTLGHISLTDCEVCGILYSTVNKGGEVDDG